MARPFRLQTVARLREAARDAARARLGDAVRAADLLERQRAEVTERFAELTRQRRHASETADTAWLLNAGRYELVLRGDQARVEQDLAKVAAEIERRRAALAEAERELKALEVLRERAERARRVEEKKREARVLDEFASRRASAATTEKR